MLDLYKMLLLKKFVGGSGGGGDATLINKSITSNGTYNASDDSADGFKKVVANVPNTYSASDEGKVVSSGALVAQTAHAQVTSNGTVDTTTNNSVEVAVPLPSGTKQISITQNGTTTENVAAYAGAEITVAVPAGGGLTYEEGTYTAAADSIPEISFANAHAKAPDFIAFADVSDTACATGNTITFFQFFDSYDTFGKPIQAASGTTINTFYAYSRLASNLSSGQGAGSYTQSKVSSTKFSPYAGTNNFLCRAGQTYKWIAVWR